MKKIYLLQVLLVNLILLLFPSVVAANTHKISRHTHGEVELTIVKDADTLQINLIAPAESILGFEHQAVKEKDINTVRNARNLLNKPTQLFSFIGTQCKTRETDINTKDVLSTHQSHDDEHHHGHSKHQSNDIHSEIKVTYLFKCSQFQALQKIKVNLIDYFPRIEKINAMWVTQHEQNANQLSAKNNTIKLMY